MHEAKNDIRALGSYRLLSSVPTDECFVFEKALYQWGANYQLRLRSCSNGREGWVCTLKRGL